MLSVDRADQVAVVTFDRPPLNALNEELVTRLAAVTRELAADTETRAVVVRSALEGVFMAGADLLDFDRLAAEPERAAAVQDVFTAFAELPQPTVAAINGQCVRVHRSQEGDLFTRRDREIAVQPEAIDLAAQGLRTVMERPEVFQFALAADQPGDRLKKPYHR